MQRFYESRKAWFDKLPERKYIITEFLPSCKERVLNVGLDDFNANASLTTATLTTQQQQH